MKDKKISRRTHFSFFGYFLFFITIAVTVSLAVMIYAVVEERSRSNNKVIAFAMLGSIIFLSSICTGIDILRRKIMVERPVMQILNATKRITSGDFSVKINVRHSIDRYDEYDLIIENLNKMVSELSKTELLRTDFISNVSHELKTPLAIIQNYAAALQDKHLDEVTRKRYAETLVSASKRLSDLIVNILKLSKLENQEILPGREKIELGEMLRETILQYEELLEQKNIELICDIDDMILYSSASYLEIVWNNLLSNAIKFTEPGGKIEISLKTSCNQVIAKIKDTGCGISPETGKHIFEKFYQGDTSHSQEGNGLGLALVKKVIDLLGGSIEVDSVLKEGTAFTIKLDDSKI